MKQPKRFTLLNQKTLTALTALALAGSAGAASPYDADTYGTQWNFSIGAGGNDVRAGNGIDVTSDGTIFVFNGAHSSQSWGFGATGSINGGVGAISPLGNKLFGSTVRGLPGMINPNQNYSARGHAAGNRAYGVFNAAGGQYWTGEDGKDNNRGSVYSLDSSGLSSIADRHSISVFADNNGTPRTDPLAPITTGLTPATGSNRVDDSALRDSTLDLVLTADIVAGDFGTAGDYEGYGLRQSNGAYRDNAFLPGIAVYNFNTNTLSGPAKQPIVTFDTSADLFEVTDIQCVADVAGSLNGTYFDVNGKSGTHRFWIDVDNTGVAPGDPGAGVYEIDITADATADAVAAATQAVIDALDDFGATVTTDTVTITDAHPGTPDDAVDSGATGFTITVTTQGFKAPGSNFADYISAGIDQATGHYYGGGVSHARGESSSDAFDPDASGPAPAIPISGPSGIGTAYDSSHNLLYSVVWDGPGTNIINFIAPSDDGTNAAFWAGEFADAAYIEKRDATGAIIWSDSINATIDIFTAEETDIQCVADVASSLNGTYFDLTGAGGTYRIWYDVDNTGVAPADPGAGLIEIDITAGATADAVAAATQVAIDAQADFGATVTTDTVAVTDANPGDRTDAADSGSTGFTITVITQGGAVSSPGVERVVSVEIDSDGNLFVTGYFQNEADGGATGGSNAYDTFVRKYTKNAEDDYSVAWHTSGGLPAIRDLAHDAALESDGTLYTFSDTFGQWADNNPTLHTYAGAADILVLKWIPGDFADGTGAPGSDGIVDFLDVQLVGDTVKPGLAGDDTYDFDGDGDSTTADVNHLITELMDRVLSDIHQDALATDVDNADIGKAIGNSGVGTLYVDGDTDWDGDVEADDIAAVAGAFTGAVGPPSERTTRTAGATLLYNPDTGEVYIKADEADGGTITSFQLENAEGTFVPAGYNGPTGGTFGGAYAEATADVIGDTDTTLAGFSGLPSLGTILPTGLDLAGLEAYLVTAVYTGAAGTGQKDFTLELGALSDYNIWALLYPGADLTDPDADLDGDGLTNDEERLFGLDPTDPASQSPITVGLDATAGTFTFTRRDDALTGAFTDIEWSLDLQAWTRDSGANLVVTGPDANGVETVAVTLSPALLANTELFVRINQNDGTLYSEDFESGDGGYTLVGAPNDWEFGTPNSDNQSALTALTTGNGGSANAWGTVLGDGLSPSGGITPGSDSILRSPNIDLAAATNATLSFAAVIDANIGNTVEVNVYNAADDSPLATIPVVDTSGGVVEADWSPYGPFDISAGDGLEVYLEFRFVGDNDIYIGFYIDDVSVGQAP